MREEYKKYVRRALFLLLLFLLAMMFTGCSRYFTPEKYANPKRKYEVQRRKVY